MTRCTGTWASPAVRRARCKNKFNLVAHRGVLPEIKLKRTDTTLDLSQTRKRSARVSRGVAVLDLQAKRAKEEKKEEENEVAEARLYSCGGGGR